MRDRFGAYQKTSPEKRAVFLETIANNIEALGDALISKASEETNLPAPRLTGERGRTTMQLRMFAQMLREGSWVEAAIDTAIPDKTPPRPDIRKMLIPVGPVVVFGASNFPFAYSTAGGDTASALAAGCPVVVKGHPAHLQTSIMVAGAIEAAIQSCGMPAHTFQHVTDASFEAGKALVQHPATQRLDLPVLIQAEKLCMIMQPQEKIPSLFFQKWEVSTPLYFFRILWKKMQKDLQNNMQVLSPWVWDNSVPIPVY
jgi:alpha-ketoglutaric semialdehyde dehydrogenase